MLKPEFSGQFKRDYKLAVRRGCDPKKLEAVITNALCAAAASDGVSGSRAHKFPQL